MSKSLPRGVREWRAVPDFPDYEVSNDGLVRSWRVPLNGKRPSYPLPHVLALSNNDGYLFVTLRKKGSKNPSKVGVHRLMALTFLPNPEELPQVAHKNGVRNDNRIKNLRWSSVRDNALDMRKHGTMHDGEKSPVAKLTINTAKSIIDEHRRGVSQAQLSVKYGVHGSQISRIINGLRWGHALEALHV